AADHLVERGGPGDGGLGRHPAAPALGRDRAGGSQVLSGRGPGGARAPELPGADGDLLPRPGRSGPGSGQDPDAPAAAGRGRRDRAGRACPLSWAPHRPSTPRACCWTRRCAAAGGACSGVPMDGFHLADAALERLGRAERKGAPDTFDAAGYVALLQRLRTARPTDPPVWAPMFERDLEQPLAGAIEVPADVPLVITEGNYLLCGEGPWAQVRILLDACWFVEVPEALRHERLISRHERFGKPPRAARDWALGPDESNARLVAATRDRADAVISLP